MARHIFSQSEDRNSLPVQFQWFPVSREFQGIIQWSSVITKDLGGGGVVEGGKLVILPPGGSPVGIYTQPICRQSALLTIHV